MEFNNEPWYGNEAIEECKRSFPLERINKELAEIESRPDKDKLALLRIEGLLKMRKECYNV